MSTQLLLHIGLPKTATTTLQNEVFFPSHPGKAFAFLGRSDSSSGRFYPVGPILKSVLEDREAIFRKRKAGLRVELQELMRSSTQRCSLISEELLGEFLEYQSYRRSVFVNLPRIASLTEGIDVTPIITVRNQSQLFRSLFVEWYPRHFFNDVRRRTFQDFVSEELSQPDRGTLQMGDYDRIVKLCVSLFGNAHVLVFEELLACPDLFAANLSKLIYADTDWVASRLVSNRLNATVIDRGRVVARNPSAFDRISRLVNQVPWLLNLKNKYLYRNLLLSNASLRLSRLLSAHSGNHRPLDDTLTPETSAAFDELFRVSNCNLQERLGLNLAQYGYPT